jgi:hypothetical protein
MVDNQAQSLLPRRSKRAHDERLDGGGAVERAVERSNVTGVTGGGTRLKGTRGGWQRGGHRQVGRLVAEKDNNRKDQNHTADPLTVFGPRTVDVLVKWDAGCHGRVVPTLTAMPLTAWAGGWRGP